MDSTIIVAMIGGVATIAAGAFTVIKKKPKDATDGGLERSSSQVSLQANNTSESNLAIGNNISQVFQKEVHHHHGLARAELGPFRERIASKPSLESIADSIHAAKPFDKIQVQKNYEGVQVSWLVKFDSIGPGPDDNGRWHVSFASLEKHWNTVSINVDLDQYPKFKVMDSGHLCWVEGRIAEIWHSSVYLGDDAIITIE